MVFHGKFFIYTWKNCEFTFDPREGTYDRTLRSPERKSSLQSYLDPLGAFIGRAVPGVGWIIPAHDVFRIIDKDSVYL